MSDSITPVITAEELYTPAKKEYAETSPGLYRMATAGSLKVSRSQAGNRRLEVFFKHTDENNKGLKGVNGKFNLEGQDKNGRSLARNFGDLLAALGVSREAITSGAVSVQTESSLDSIPADEQWKGVAANITINGDIADFSGKEVIAKVEAGFGSSTKPRVGAVYPVRA